LPTEGPNSDTTVDVASVTIEKAGIYAVSYYVNGKATGNTPLPTTASAVVTVNSSPKNETESSADFTTATDSRQLTNTSLLSLAVGDIVQLNLSADSAAELGFDQTNSAGLTVQAVKLD
jgi:ribosomal protein S10